MAPCRGEHAREGAATHITSGWGRGSIYPSHPSTRCGSMCQQPLPVHVCIGLPIHEAKQAAVSMEVTMHESRSAKHTKVQVQPQQHGNASACTNGSLITRQLQKGKIYWAIRPAYRTGSVQHVSNTTLLLCRLAKATLDSQIYSCTAVATEHECKGCSHPSCSAHQRGSFRHCGHRCDPLQTSIRHNVLP